MSSWQQPWQHDRSVASISRDARSCVDLCIAGLTDYIGLVSNISSLALRAAARSNLASPPRQRDFYAMFQCHNTGVILEIQ